MRPIGRSIFILILVPKSENIISKNISITATIPKTEITLGTNLE